MFIKPKRVKNVPPYLFNEINKKKQNLIEQGVDIIDLGIGCPDLPTPQHIVNRLIEEMKDPDNFKYPGYSGCLEFRKAVAQFYKDRFNVDLDPETEILALIGSKEGISHFITASIDPGDVVLLPDPGYPTYRTATYLANGIPYSMALLKENGFLPDFTSIPVQEVEKAKLMFLNYPGNPTAATADLAFFQGAVDFARRNQMVVAHDAAYQMVTFNGYTAPSILQVEGAKEIAVEFGSLSKTYSMTGWRIGYAVGNKEALQSLSVVKSNMDTSQFLPIQKAAATALVSEQYCVEEYNQIYRERMEGMLAALREIGIESDTPKGSFFIWASVPEGYTSSEFATKVLEEAGVIVTPGVAFGEYGEGYFRISLSVPTERLYEAIHRIKTKITITV
ncbi:LL-diaminopimelate aminotransferase [Peribacillus butanolivorans]|uniref:LL-diaminopimelate aminotransferase n=1 Tax=Peribacillus butanolivorans TaxID=421767 RepID=UPI0036D9C315